ncbi:hypothetical protein CYMTET_43112 [Cymbomonas tetramitiformis]|uniref:Uncharacterized protein n=1 Tax=Cymbomonas tetramitiformis TaxID=36881 RepID=A0AAE0F0V8_9CHLO|nr:hypothetical protein CYMTET_43112 [Cymbomonas tetramitiformis]
MQPKTGEGRSRASAGMHVYFVQLLILLGALYIAFALLGSDAALKPRPAKVSSKHIGTDLARYRDLVRNLSAESGNQASATESLLTSILRNLSHSEHSLQPAASKSSPTSTLHKHRALAEPRKAVATLSPRALLTSILRNLSHSEHSLQPAASKSSPTSTLHKHRALAEPRKAVATLSPRAQSCAAAFQGPRCESSSQFPRCGGTAFKGTWWTLSVAALKAGAQLPSGRSGLAQDAPC